MCLMSVYTTEAHTLLRALSGIICVHEYHVSLILTSRDKKWLSDMMSAFNCLCLPQPEDKDLLKNIARISMRYKVAEPN